MGINVKSFHFFDFPEYKEDEEPERNIDIFFIFFVGTKTARREAIFKKLKEAYPSKTIEFVFDWSLSAPANLTSKLKKAKVCFKYPIP